MPSVIIDEDGRVVSFTSFMDDSSFIQRLFDLVSNRDLALTDESGIALEGLAFGRFSDSEPHTFGVLVGASPTYREERKFLRKNSVREPRDWVGTIRYQPDHSQIKFSGEAYGPKGAEDEGGHLMWLDDSLMIIVQLLDAVSHLPEGSSGIMYHRQETQVRSELLPEEQS